MQNMKALHIIAFILLIVGGLNWLLVVFGWNLVDVIFGGIGLTSVVYVLVGLAALLELFTHRRNCKVCAPSGMTNSMPGGMAR